MPNTTLLEDYHQHLEAQRNLRHFLAGYSDDDDSVSAFSEEPLSEDGNDKPSPDPADEQVTEDDLFPPEEDCISAFHDGFGTGGRSEIQTAKTFGDAPLCPAAADVSSERQPLPSDPREQSVSLATETSATDSESKESEPIDQRQQLLCASPNDGVEICTDARTSTPQTEVSTAEALEEEENVRVPHSLPPRTPPGASASLRPRPPLLGGRNRCRAALSTFLEQSLCTSGARSVSLSLGPTLALRA